MSVIRFEDNPKVGVVANLRSSSSWSETNQSVSDAYAVQIWTNLFTQKLKNFDLILKKKEATINN